MYLDNHNSTEVFNDLPVFSAASPYGVRKPRKYSDEASERAIAKDDEDIVFPALIRLTEIAKAQKPLPYDLVIVDDFGRACAQRLEKAKETNRDGRAAYGEMYDFVLDVQAGLQIPVAAGLSYVFLMISEKQEGVTAIADENGRVELMNRPHFPGQKLVNEFPALLTWQVYMQNDPRRVYGENLLMHLHSFPAAELKARFRGPDTPPSIVNPTIDDLFALSRRAS